MHSAAGRLMRLCGTISLAMASTLNLASAEDIALEALRMKSPDVRWRKPVLHGNFTGHGVTDSAVLGVSRTAILVATIVGPVRVGSEVLTSSWPIGQDGIDAECVRRAVLTTERVSLPAHLDDGRQRSGDQRGLRLELPQCGTLHLYCDPPARWFSWWREFP
jgi:hypothetical protein